LNCLFCGVAPPLTREHLISKPVASAFGIDRTGELSTLDDMEIVRSAPLEQLAVRLPCGSCNSGWMNDLETGMGFVARWMRARENGITLDTLGNLERWLLKSYIVMTAMDGGIRRFGSDDDFSMIPEATRARRLRAGGEDAFDRVAFGYGRRRRPFPNNFGYVIGNPTVRPQGPRYANCRSAGAAVFVLGLLEAWIVVPVLTPAITLPAGLRQLQSGDRFRSLPSRDGLPILGEVVVDNGEHDWSAVSDALADWARHQAGDAA
jgi:hypothetical protein